VIIDYLLRYDIGFGQHHHFRVRRDQLQPRDRLDARSARHVEIEHQDAGPVPSHVSEGHLNVARLGQHLYVGLSLEQHAQTATHHRVIIRKHESDRVVSGGRPHEHEPTLFRAGVTHDQLGVTVDYPGD
jgi:hypothetical protein